MPISKSVHSYISAATCHLIDETDFDERVAVYLPNGFFAVLCHNRIVGCCDIGIHNISKVTLFHTYDQFSRLYLLSTTKSLIMVLHHKTLEVVQTYKNVDKYLIHDFSGTGRPQLHIWANGQTEPISGDFSNKTLLVAENPVTLALRTRLQLLRGCLDEEKKKLCEKQSLRRKTVEKLFYKNSEGANVGSIPEPNGNLLIVKNTWQRFYQSKWIIGASVRNSSSMTLSNIRLCSRNSVINTQVLTKSLQSPEKIRNSSIKPNEVAYIVGVLTPPAFQGNSTSLELMAAIFAQVDGQSGIVVASTRWVLKASEVIDGSLTLFKDVSKNGAGEDVAAFCSVSRESVNLDINSKSAFSGDASVRELLTQESQRLGFQGLAGAEKVILTCQPAGLLIKFLSVFAEIFRNRSRICLHAVEVKDALLLVRSLHSVFPDYVETMASSAESSPSSDPAIAFANALSSELEAILCKNTRLGLAPLELETDLAVDKLQFIPK